MIPIILTLFNLSAFSQQQLNTQLLGVFDKATSDLPVFSGVQYNDVWGHVTPGGMEIAIVGNSKYNLFIDVTDPANPTELYRHAPGNPEIWRDYKTYKGYAYGVCDSCNEGISVYDMTNLDCSGTITHVRQITAQFGSSHNIFIDEDNHRLYAVGVPGATDIYVYDLLSDPSNPSLLAAIDFNTVVGSGGSFYVHDIYVRDNIAYCSHGYEGLYIWDLNDISNTGSNSTGGTIELMASDDYGGYNHSSWVTEDGQFAIVAEEVPLGQPLVTVDLTNLQSANPSIFDSNQFSDHLEANGKSTAHNPFIRNNFAFISYYEDGLKIYDYSTPSNPSLYAYYDTYPTNNGSYPGGYEGAWGCYPFLPSGNILVTDVTFGLHIISVTGTETCADGILNQDETEIDCGGKYCLPCASCSDGIQNQDEAGIDCGGTICCTPCGETCSDGIQNQDETGIDCGGSQCQSCECTNTSAILTSTVTSNTIERYQSFFITSGPVAVEQSVSASYYAGNFLTLNPEFEVKEGAELLLSIEQCQ